MTHAQDFEANRGVLESIGKKLGMYHGTGAEEGEVSLSPKYGSYKEAEQAGDVAEMIASKRADAKADAKARDVVALSKQYASELSIIDIQKRLPVAEKSFNKAKAEMERIYNTELDDRIREYRQSIGGLQNEDLARGKAIEAVDEWAKNDVDYKNAKAYYLVAKSEFTALKTAKDMFIEDNRDLIEEELKRARRKELLASGILEELGITPSEE